MKCKKCNAEFEEGMFCPECGTKLDEATINKSDENVAKNMMNNDRQVENEEVISEIPWYLTLPIIILVYFITYFLKGIPGILLALIRLIKYKQNRRNVCIVVICLLLLFVVKRNESAEGEIVSQEYVEDIPFIGDVLINIDYEKGSLAYNDDVIIYVDDVEIGEIEAGENISFEVILDQGKHEVQVKRDALLRRGKSNKYEFYIEYEFTEVNLHLKDESIGGLKLIED